VGALGPRALWAPPPKKSPVLGIEIKYPIDTYKIDS